MEKKLREHQAEFEKTLEQIISSFSSSLNASMQQLKQIAGTRAIEDGLQKVYRQMLADLQALGALYRKSLEEYPKLISRCERLEDENKRLETLYSAGIQFSTEIERRALLEKAMDIVASELQADAGYIVLLNPEGDVEHTIGRNLDPDEAQMAKDLSSSVIKNTLQSKKPTQVEDASQDINLARQSSILYLDIKAALCVPLMMDSQAIGAVYLDRRNSRNPFTETDLSFLLAFSRQIVQGINVSRKFSELEEKLVSDAALTMEDLRQEFHCDEIIGSGNGLFGVLKLAARIAPTDASVLILGESGTGKELIANAIHQNSPRKEGPFVAINCGAIPGELLESELFGYEKGAFTGAVQAKPGKLETADGGTIFLDEIGEMEVRLQAKLLRVLQTREIERVGSVATRPIDVRILAATNKNLQELISQKKFREDLYYRLKVIELKLPPLRDRREDILELSNYFIQKYRSDQSTLALSEEALDILESYHWPGNIRELENVIQRGVLLAKGPQIEPQDLPLEIVESGVSPETMQGSKTLWEAEQDFRRQYVQKVLRKSRSKAEAAKLLGVNRTYLYKILEELNIK